MIEEKTYLVTITLTAQIDFAPIERDSPITQFDAIQNALGTVDQSVWDALEGEGWNIDTKAEAA